MNFGLSPEKRKKVTCDKCLDVIDLIASTEPNKKRLITTSEGPLVISKWAELFDSQAAWHLSLRVKNLNKKDYVTVTAHSLLPTLELTS